MIATVVKPVLRIFGRYPSQRCIQGSLQRLAGAGGGRAQVGFEFTKGQQIIRISLHIERYSKNPYAHSETALAHNTALQLVQHEGMQVVMLTPLPAQSEPASLARLRAQLTNRLPQVELAALLLEVEAFTGFASAFTHVADGPPSPTDLPLSICAVLLAQACNIGLKTVARADVPA